MKYVEGFREVLVTTEDYIKLKDYRQAILDILYACRKEEKDSNFCHKIEKSKFFGLGKKVVCVPYTAEEMWDYLRDKCSHLSGGVAFFRLEGGWYSVGDAYCFGLNDNFDSLKCLISMCDENTDTSILAAPHMVRVYKKICKNN